MRVFNEAITPVAKNFVLASAFTYSHSAGFNIENETHHCGMRVAMISVISNMASGLSTQKMSHELTLSGVKLATEKLKQLVNEFVKQY